MDIIRKFLTERKRDRLGDEKKLKERKLNGMTNKYVYEKGN